MFRAVSAFIGVRYARVNKGNQFISFINVFSVLGITLGLAALIVVSSVMNGFEAQLKRKILSLVPHIVVQSDIAPAVEQLPDGILDSTAWFELQTVVQSPSALQGVLLRGISPEQYTNRALTTEYIEQGSLTDLVERGYGVVIGQELARTLSVSINDKLRVIVPGQLLHTPLGTLPKQRKMTVVGIYRSGSEMDGRLIYVHRADAARLTRRGENQADTYRLYLEDAFTLDEVIQQLPSHLKVLDTWRNRQGPLFDAVKMEKNMMALMLMLIIAVAAFNIVSSLVMVVSEKKSDIAILRTQGLGTWGVMQVFVFNGMFNGVKGCCYGVALGLLIASQINPLLFALDLIILPIDNGQILPIVMAPASILWIVLLSLLFCFFATLYPAYAAAKQQPASALRYE